MSISRGRTHLTGLKGRLITYAFATTIAVAAVAPAAHAGTIISTAAPQPTSAYLPPCDGPVLDQPSFVGQVGNQFQVRGTGHCFTPGSSAIGEMWDSMGRRLDRAQFVINPNGALEGVNAFVLYVEPYSTQYCGFLSITVKFTDLTTGRSASRVACTAKLSNF